MDVSISVSQELSIVINEPQLFHGLAALHPSSASLEAVCFLLDFSFPQHPPAIFLKEASPAKFSAKASMFSLSSCLSLPVAVQTQHRKGTISRVSGNNRVGPSAAESPRRM